MDRAGSSRLFSGVPHIFAGLCENHIGESRIEGGVSAGIGRTSTGERHQRGQDIVLEPGTAGKRNRGIHGQDLSKVGQTASGQAVRCLFFVIPRCAC
ncbi:MAG: hypothetical protein ACK4Z7_11245, partial [Novosphingobium sp.]